MTCNLFILAAASFVVGLIVGIASDDFRARAASDEVMACKDEPDRAAYYARRPGEAHTVERCIKVFRYSAPAWIPEFSHPLGGKSGCATNRYEQAGIRSSIFRVLQFFLSMCAAAIVWFGGWLLGNYWLNLNGERNSKWRIFVGSICISAGFISWFTIAGL